MAIGAGLGALTNKNPLKGGFFIKNVSEYQNIFFGNSMLRTRL